ncbi:MAG: hypothetical protein AAGJ32_01780 [Pseudomonadota bacterium]
MSVAAPTSVSGKLNTRNIKRLAQLARTSTVGPTATYYAGVTAPVISAGVAIFTKNALTLARFDPFWAWYASAFLAAFTGIVWYLVFMRWSYRSTYGRGGELSERSDVILRQDGLTLVRGPILMQAQWSAVKAVRLVGKDLAIFIDGADPVMVPAGWFETQAHRDAFVAAVRAKIA